jgi:hypothetical protein
MPRPTSPAVYGVLLRVAAAIHSDWENGRDLPATGDRPGDRMIAKSGNG